MAEALQGYFTTETIIGWLVGILAGSVVIEIVPIKVNPWGWFFKKVLKEANLERDTKMTDISKDVKKLEEKLDGHIKDDSDDKIRACRHRILRFADEARHGENHSEEHYNNVLDDIKRYDKYYVDNPLEKNHKAMSAIATIKSTYDHKVNKVDGDGFLD